MAPSRRSLGQRGEVFVTEHLCRSGYAILERNWRTTSGEIDIIARQPGDPPVIVFVEVRTRRGPLEAAIEAALESVNERKQERLINLAQAYLASQNLDEVPWRIDVAAVACTGDRLFLEVIPHAVGW